jgi:hypothetical protein
VDDVNDELFEELERSVREGKIRSFGIGSEADAAREIYRADRRFCPIMQFEWSVVSGRSLSFPGSFLITHRTLSQDFAWLRGWLGNNPAIARRWSQELGLDVASPPVLSRLMLAAARRANAGGITSRRAENIRANAMLMLDGAALGTGAAFAGCVARDILSLASTAQPGELHPPVGKGAGRGKP